MRLGSFHSTLVAWTGRPCKLVMQVAANASPLVVTGILQPHVSRSSLRGWALVPPAEFGGSGCFQPTPLPFDTMPIRRVLREGAGVRLRYFADPDVVFELELLPDRLTAAPRPIEGGRHFSADRRDDEPWAS